MRTITLIMFVLLACTVWGKSELNFEKLKSKGLENVVITIGQDSTKGNDKIVLNDGTVIFGEVIKIGEDFIEFKRNDNENNFEYLQSDTRYIVWNDNKIQFNTVTNTSSTQVSQPIAPPVVVEHDDGAPVALIILATVGAVLLVLVLIGAAAS